MSSETSQQPTFQLFTSLRYDPLLLQSEQNSQPNLNFITPSPFYMLTYHRDRMLEAAQHFEFDKVAKKLEDGPAVHELLLSKVKEWVGTNGKDQPLKLRVLFDRTSNLSLDIAPVPPVPHSVLFPPSISLPTPKPTPHPAQKFTPSPLTGGALTLGPTDSLPASTSPSPTASDISTMPKWTLRLDKAPTQTSPFTSLKTTHRPVYDTARSRALPTNPSAPAFTEVMLYNSCNELTEGTTTSLYFYRGGRWVTPPVGVPAGKFTASALAEAEEGHPERDEGEDRIPFAGRWGHSVRSAKVGSGGQRGTTRRWALAMGMCMEEPVSVDTVKVGETVWVSNGVRGFGCGIVVE